MKRTTWYIFNLITSLCFSHLILAANSSSSASGSTSASGYVELIGLNQAQYQNQQKFLDEIKNIEDVIIPDLITTCDKNGWKAKWQITNDESLILITAAATNNVSVVEYLLSENSKYDIKKVLRPSNWGKSALHSAVGGGHLQIMWLLLTSKYSERFLKPDTNGFTALHMAAKNKKLEAAKLLLTFHPELAFMEHSDTCPAPQPLDELLKGKTLALAIGALDIAQVNKFALDADAWDKESEELLINIFKNKTDKNTDKVNEIIKALEKAGVDPAHPAFKVLNDFAVGSLKDVVFAGWIKILLNASPLSNEYIDTLKAMATTTVDVLGISPGLRFHAPTLELLIERINLKRFAN
jgi:hypothetical protein